MLPNHSGGLHSRITGTAQARCTIMTIASIEEYNDRLIYLLLCWAQLRALFSLHSLRPCWHSIVPLLFLALPQPT